MSVDPRAATLAPTGETADGQVLGGRYEVVGLLGSGAMGNVYRARDRELDVEVALKVLQPHLVSSPEALDRFCREVKLARRVTHPNVARVYDLSEHEGQRVLTMELIDGESLGSRLQREGRLSTAEAIRVTREIGAGVGAAHAAGVVHRDLKPDNVLCEKGGRIVVTDFGIARAMADGVGTVGLVGTPAYMAPEQVDAGGTIDERTDVYALGCVLFEMLAGRPAWTGQSIFELAAARVLQEPPDLATVRPDLPHALTDLVRSTMAREPSQRLPSMSALDGALSALGVPGTLPPGAAPTPLGGVDSPGLGTTGTHRRVAVLPFINRGRAEDEYIADGLTDDLIDGLSVAEGLRVRSRGVVMPLKGTTRDPRELGRQLDVQVFVEGSIRRTPAGFRVTARLVSVLDGFQLWARRFDVAEESLLVENDRIAAAIAEALSADLQTSARVVAPDAATVELYLKARQAYWSSFSGDEVEAKRLFEELVARTPDDPKALAGLVMTGTHTLVWPAGNHARLATLADQAIALGPQLPDGHAARAALDCFSGDDVSGVMHARRALAIAPTCIEALECLGRVLSQANSDAGRRYLEAALALDPTYELTYVSLVTDYTLSGLHERGHELLAAMDARSPGLAVRVQPVLLAYTRDRDGALRLIERLEQLPADSKQRGMLMAWLRVVAYDEPMGEVVPPLPPGTVLPRFQQCFLTELRMAFAAYLGDIEVAMEALAELDRLGSYNTKMVEKCPVLDVLRALPESEAPRTRIAERAQRVVDAYYAPLG